jgi:hypothetical protein
VVGLAKGSTGRTWRVRLAWLPEALGILGLALLIFALARPQLTRRETVVQSEGIDIMLAIDTSGSMDAMDFEVNGREMNRLEVAKLVVGEFIRQRAYDRVGLVVFGEEAFTQAPLTLDHEGLLRFLSNVEIGIAGRSATAVGEAIAVSAARLSRLEAPTKVAIVLTDGRSNAGQVGPIEAAKAAAALGVRVYTIGVARTFRRQPRWAVRVLPGRRPRRDRRGHPHRRRRGHGRPVFSGDRHPVVVADLRDHRHLGAHDR